jgi:predicted lysophospholipase L1 biosynthesis ABC-type transport system permease subunit
MKQPASAKIQRQINLPLNQAFRISLRNITLRLGRAIITGAGTLLGIAFLMAVFTQAITLRARGAGALDESMVARQQWLVAMSLLASAVGITNSMLMSVTERFREIGTMKCLGALDNFIVKLFLIESALLGVLGSLVGAVIGMSLVLITYLLRGGALGRLDYSMLLEYFLLSLALGTALSVLAALPPAIRAAKLPPASALRTEI